MLLSNELVGKNVEIEIAEFAVRTRNSYKGVVEKIVYYGENVVYIKLDTGKLINSKYIRVIEIID